MTLKTLQAIASWKTWCLVFVAACGTNQPTADRDVDLETRSADASRIVKSTRDRFDVDNASYAALARPNGPAALVQFDHVGERIVARQAKGLRHNQAFVELPAHAQQPFRVTDAHSGMSMEVALQGATQAPAEFAENYVVYQNAYHDGAHVLHHVIAEGTEDFILFEQAPREPSVSYSLAITSGVAGLRLVGNSLELLDASGTPRLRVAPPYLTDTHLRRIDATLAVDDCKIDTNPAPPWGRDVTPPGANHCTVRISWDTEAVDYPALMDPAWILTTAMATARSLHSENLLPNGRVLVAGGKNGTGSNGIVATAEIYDPGSGTWAATANLSYGCYSPSANELADGRVLLVGGYSKISGYNRNGQIYDPTTGTWGLIANMSAIRYGHTATLLKDGRVIVVGGTNDGIARLNTAEIYDPIANTWTAAPSLGQGRIRHTASLLGNGRVLISGGTDGAQLSSSTMYDPGTNAWLAAATMTKARQDHTANVLADGRVLVAGGSGPGAILRSTEIYDPMVGTWSATGDMIFVNDLHDAVVLLDGRVLVIPSGTSTAQVYDPASGTWSLTPSMKKSRSNSAAIRLTDGRVLVSGGLDANTYVASAELYDLAGAPIGTKCLDSIECKNGACVDGVCCASACGGGDSNDCQSCNVMGSEGTCVVFPLNTVCRAAADVCDVAEVCNGQSELCPVDAVLPATTECRAAADACDAAEMCDGQSAVCPSDGYLAEGTICRPAAGGCDVAESCTGLGIYCPTDFVAEAKTICRPAANVCDIDETCDGLDPLCPKDAFVTDGTSCADNGVCQTGSCQNLGSGGAGGNGGSGGSSTGEGGGSTGGTNPNSDCSCRTVGFSERSGINMIAVLALAAMARRRTRPLLR